MCKEGDDSSITKTKLLKQVEKACRTFGISWTGKQQETFPWLGHYAVPDTVMKNKTQNKTKEQITNNLNSQLLWKKLDTNNSYNYILTLQQADFAQQ